MDIIQKKLNEIIVLKMEGRLDTNTATIFEEKLMGLSSGLRVLLMAGKKLKTTNGKLGLCSLQPHIKEVFDVAGFTMLFSMFLNQDEAIKKMQ